MENRITLGLLFLCSLIFCFLSPSISCSSELTLAIANSTCKSMKKVGKIFTAKTSIKLNYLCQPSGLLAQGIKEGAIDADYFLSANEKWMDEVVDIGLVNPESVRNNWGNQLVLVSLQLKEREVKLQSLADLNKPEVQQIIMGNPAVAPYGMYAREAMLNAELWGGIQDKLKYNRKISISARTLKKYGHSKRGVVALLYKTSVKGNLLTHFVVPQHLYTPIKYFCAPLINSRKKSELAQFLSFSRSAEANEIFRSAGFTVNP